MATTINHFEISEPKLSYLGSVDLDTLDEVSTDVTIRGVPFSLTIKSEGRVPAQQPQLQGYWQDFVISNLDGCAKNVRVWELDTCSTTISFANKGVQHTLTATFSKPEPVQVEHVDTKPITKGRNRNG